MFANWIKSRKVCLLIGLKSRKVCLLIGLKSRKVYLMKSMFGNWICGAVFSKLGSTTKHGNLMKSTLITLPSS